MPGVVFGPEPELPNFRINWGTPYQRNKKKSWARQARRARLARRKVQREERLARREQMRLLRESQCEDLPARPQRAEKKTNRTTHHGTEEVTSQVGTNLKMSIENL